MYEDFLAAPGRWYVVHSYAGHERRVKTNLQLVTVNNDLEEAIYQIEVPMETVWEVHNGERKKIERVKMPGYILIRVDMENPLVWNAIKSTAGVTGFVGLAGKPIPLDSDEVWQMIRPIAAVVEKEEKQALAAVDFYVGDHVRVTSGPFQSLPATVADVNAVARRVTVTVDLFGRETPVELEYDQVERYV